MATEDQKKKIWDAFVALPTNSFEFRIERMRMQKGRSFSSEALDQYIETITLFIGARAWKRWQETGEPPTAMSVKVTVDVH